MQGGDVYATAIDRIGLLVLTLGWRHWEARVPDRKAGGHGGHLAGLRAGCARSRPYIGGSHPAISPNRDVIESWRLTCWVRRIPRHNLNHWKWPNFNKWWEKSWSAKAPKLYTFWKLDSRAITFSLSFFFALGHSLFSNKEEKAPTFRRPRAPISVEQLTHRSTLIGCGRELLLTAHGWRRSEQA